MLTRRELLRFSAGRKAPRHGYWIHLSRPAMACRFEATLPISDRAGMPVARDSLALADRLEQQLTIFDQRSEVSHINRAAALHRVLVEPSLFELLLLCQELSIETQGAFDITSGPLSDCWGFLRRQGRIPQSEEIDAARVLVGAERVVLDRASRTIRFQLPGMFLNLGSIGKGYALDSITARMRPGVRAGLLSAGSSSLSAIGSPGHGGWVVGVRDPARKGARLAVLGMRDCAMATSGLDEQFFEHSGKRYGHIIDPRTGLPAEGVASVTVVAHSAAMADALATAFFVGGPALASSYTAAHPGVLAIMVASGAEHPSIFGSNPRCEVQITRE